MSNVKHTPTHRQRQALATQKLIVDAARQLFLKKGYAVTTIEDISRKAGVAVSTVYAVFKNKRGILRAIRQAWHEQSGQRDIFQKALEEAEPERRLELAAHATRRQWETGAEMTAIYESAAASDAEAAAERAEALSGRRKGMADFIQASSDILHPGLSAEQQTAIFLALTRIEVYRELVYEAGWTPGEYEAWLAGILKQQLLL